jgi:DNA-directed RNA polymerase subunit H
MESNKENEKYFRDVFRSRKTIIDLLKKRGYDMSNVISDMSFDIFNEMSNYDIFDANTEIYVYYVPDKVKLNNENMNNYINIITEKYGNDIKIIMIYTNISSALLEEQIKNVQLFNLCEVIIDKTKHEQYSVEHVIMSNKIEVEELLNKYLKDKKQLPQILYNDPMAKILNANRGDVIKIHRKSNSTGISYYYRICV